MSHSARAGHRIARRLSVLAGGLAAAFLTLTALAPAASAHATLLFTSPAADSAVPVSPKAITLTSNEPVTLAGPAVARWVLFAALAAALGGLAARALARRYAGPRPGPLPPPWALRACLLGLAAALVLAVLQLGGGSIAAGLAHFSLTRLVASGPGKIAVTEIAAFAAAAVALALPRAVLAVVPLLGVVAAEGLRAHPQAIVSGWAPC